MAATNPRMPSNLGPAGRALWRSVTTKLKLNATEVLTLAEACRLASLAADLEASSRERGLTAQAVSEIRKLRATVANMVRDLAPGDDSSSELARKLALKRSHTGRPVT